MAKLVPVLVLIVLCPIAACVSERAPEPVPAPTPGPEAPEAPPRDPPTGRVVDETGAPVEGAVVAYDWNPVSRACWPVPGKPGTLPTTDREGHFRWPGTPPASVRRWFAVHREHGIGIATVASGNGTPVEIRLRPTLRVDVEVFGPDGSRPKEIQATLLSEKRDPWAPDAGLPRAHVPELQRIEGPSLSLRGLSGHPFILWIHADGYRPRKLEAADILPPPGSRHREIDMHLEEGLVVSGRILDVDGGPVVNATVHVNDGVKWSEGPPRRPRYAVEPHWCLHGQTDEAGQFEIGGLADGTFLIRVNTADGKQSAVLATDIRAGTTGLELRMPAP